MRALRGDRHGVLVGMTPFGARVWLADSDASVEYVAHVFAESALTTLTRSAPERAGGWRCFARPYQLHFAPRRLATLWDCDLLLTKDRTNRRHAAQSCRLESERTHERV